MLGIVLLSTASTAHATGTATGGLIIDGTGDITAPDGTYAYTAADKTLMLNGYNGGVIRFTADNDVTVKLENGSTNPITLSDSAVTETQYGVYAAGNLTAENGKTDIWLTNPAENNIWLKVRLLDENENVLGESDLIRPGEYVQSIALDNTPQDTISVTLKIMAYEPSTYRSAGAIALNTELKAK